MKGLAGIVKRWARPIARDWNFDATTGGIPWSRGYDAHKERVITRALADDELLARFRAGRRLPNGHGVGVDERCVEYPWMLARLPERARIVLDAGSTLNHGFLLDHPALSGRTIHIMTLAPEEQCFWRRGVSYFYEDLRDIPIRDGHYDAVICLSTLEHVGCDNTLYTGDAVHHEHRPDDFVRAVHELERVLAPGGSLLLSVPFGVRRDFGSMRQFDGALLADAVAAFGEPREASTTFYRYSAEGWNVASREECSGCEYVEWITRPHDQWPRPLPVEPDRAAAARAVACVHLIKR